MSDQQEHDDRLLAELAQALGPPDAPRAAVDAARAVFTWRTIDAELAALVHDSELAGPPVGVRGDRATLRSLTYQRDEVVIDVAVDADGLVGQVVPAREGTIDVQVAGSLERTVDVDAVGSFTVRPLPDGPFRLVHGSGGRRIVTGWITP